MLHVHDLNKIMRNDFSIELIISRNYHGNFLLRSETTDLNGQIS